MSNRLFAVLFTMVVVVTLVPLPVGAQSGDTPEPMRTPDGQPDISGIFTFRTLTPFQRPSQFDGVENLSPEEAAEFEAAERPVRTVTSSTRSWARTTTDHGQRVACCHTTSSGMNAVSS